MSDNSIQILQAAKAYRDQFESRNALLAEQRSLRNKYERITEQLSQANDLLSELRDNLVNASGEFKPSTTDTDQVIAS